jgi:hypothetical protein
MGRHSLKFQNILEEKKLLMKISLHVTAQQQIPPRISAGCLNLPFSSVAAARLSSLLCLLFASTHLFLSSFDFYSHSITGITSFNGQRSVCYAVATPVTRTGLQQQLKRGEGC